MFFSAKTIIVASRIFGQKIMKIEQTLKNGSHVEIAGWLLRGSKNYIYIYGNIVITTHWKHETFSTSGKKNLLAKTF
jgi:hypothetical protein